MATKVNAGSFDIADALIRAYSTNNRINIYLLQSLTEEAWIAKPPGGKGRSIRAIVAHIHNVRLMWLKAAGAKDVPQKLDPDDVTRQQASRALEMSSRALADILGRSLSGGGRIKGFKPDAAGFFAYLVAHDAHHRGQITMLARQMGHPVPQRAMFGLWEWGTR